MLIEHFSLRVAARAMGENRSKIGDFGPTWSV